MRWVCARRTDRLNLPHDHRQKHHRRPGRHRCARRGAGRALARGRPPRDRGLARRRPCRRGRESARRQGEGRVRPRLRRHQPRRGGGGRNRRAFRALGRPPRHDRGRARRRAGQDRARHHRAAGAAARRTGAASTRWVGREGRAGFPGRRRAASSRRSTRSRRTAWPRASRSNPTCWCSATIRRRAPPSARWSRIVGLKPWHGGSIDNSAASEALTSVLIFINRRYGIDGAGFRITGTPGEAKGE